MLRLTALPVSLRATNPVAFIATWFGSGLIRPAPGTWGTLAAMPFAYGLFVLGGSTLLLIAAFVAFVAGIWASGEYARQSGKPDPSEVVIDEVAAIWLVLSIMPPSWIGWALAFASFRFFDIVKPWPVSLADSKLKGGFGIMFDDVIAAIYAMLALILLNYFLKAF